jgi:hypothetical protein
VENNNTFAQDKKIFVQSTQTKTSAELNAESIQLQIDSINSEIIEVQSAIMTILNKMTTNINLKMIALKNQMQSVSVEQVEAEPVVVVEEPERTETPDIEDDEEEEVEEYVPLVKLPHHRTISLSGLNRFEDATDNYFGSQTEKKYFEWIDAGRPEIKNWMQSVGSEQLEDEVQSVGSEQLEDEVQSVVSEQFEVEFIEEDDDEIRREAMQRDCWDMARKLTFATPFKSLELEVAYVNKLFAEWEWMREEKAKAPYTELLDEINNYMASVKPIDNLMEERLATGMAIMAYECVQMSRGEPEEEDDEEIEAELAAALERQRAHEELLAF